MLCAKAYMAVISGAVTTDGWGSDARLLAGGSGPPRRPHAPGDGARGCGGARRLARRMRPADGGGPRGVPAGVDTAKHALPKWSECPSDSRGPAKGLDGLVKPCRRRIRKALWKEARGPGCSSPSYSRRNQSRLQKRAATTAYSVPAKCGGCPAVLAAKALSRLHLQGFSRDRGE